jgi:hypothetical protein
MIKNPHINALLAALYIAVLVLSVGGVGDFLSDKPENLLMPMTMLGLFVLSVSVMWLLFFFTPAKMFFDNQKSEALTFFTETIVTFAGCVAIFIVLMFLF